MEYKREKIKFIDLFCGIGGFRVAMDETCLENDINPQCVFSSDIDKHCQDSYELNFGKEMEHNLMKLLLYLRNQIQSQVSY